jgi:hypothetical protein
MQNKLANRIEELQPGNVAGQLQAPQSATVASAKSAGRPKAGGRGFEVGDSK